MTLNDRYKVLRELLEFKKPIKDTTKKLAEFSFDFDEEPIIITKAHVVNILRLFISGRKTSDDIENWTNAIEMREDLEFEEEFEDTLEQVIHHLANPELEGKITMELCEELLALLIEQ